MTDFDFDEIDKAVNTALGSTDTTPAPEKREVEAVPQPAPRLAPAPRPVESQSAPATRRSSGRFMDVVHPSSDMRTRTAVDVPTSVAQPVSPQEEPVLDESDWSTPHDSPFLPDAQVEKRPLGGSAPTGESIPSTQDAPLLLEEPDELRLEAPDDKHLMPDPIDFAASVATPEPETPEVVAEPAPIVDEPISSDQASDADLSQAAALDAETFPVVETVEVVEAPAVVAEPAEPEAPEVPAGPVSITQQYKEKPAEAAEQGAIYDTENYHQPIAVPVKKKSGAWVILWILLILVVGGGAGAAFYFFVLPTL